MSVRERRLKSEYRSILRLSQQSEGTLSIAAVEGNPPFRYEVEFRCPGIIELRKTQPQIAYHHLVEIMLPARYPVSPPRARFLSPIVHPHVWSTREICLGYRWTPLESLDSLLLKIGAIIQWDPRYLDLQSIADAAAARWAKNNLGKLPIGGETFRCSPPEKKSDRGIDWRELR